MSRKHGTVVARLLGTPARATQRRNRRRTFNGLECLEDRRVPATFAVTTTLDVVNATDGMMSLREAISAANEHAGPDTVVLPAGIYKLTRAGADNSNAKGDLDVKDSTVIQGAGSGSTIIDGRRLDRVFDVRGSAPHAIKVTFQGLTIRNGLADAGGGGGIRVGNADLVVQDSVVKRNRTTGSGGGISNAELPGTGQVMLVRTIIDGNLAGEGGGLWVKGNSQDQGSVLTISGSTIQRNIARDGGGILASLATLSGSTVSSNHAVVGDGGGLSVTMATLTSSTISRNTAAGDGGGIDADTVSLSGSTVSRNTANSSATPINGVSGGGIRASTAMLTGSTISGNSASLGGGISAGVAMVTRCTVADNIATNSAGGGILANLVMLTGSTVSGNSADASDGGGIRASTAMLTGSTISGNSASMGGGIAAGAATLINSTVSGNHAANQGGGILSFGLNLLNDTITDNDAHTGGGVVHFLNIDTATVRNTIIADNFVDLDGAGTDVSGSFTSGGHNLIGVGAGGTGFANGTRGDHVGTDLDPIDPGLAALGSNGGPTMTHALLASSPAIDTGDNTSAPSTDQRGVARPRDGDGNGSRIVDIGAFEK